MAHETWKIIRALITLQSELESGRKLPLYKTSAPCWFFLSQPCSPTHILCPLERPLVYPLGIPPLELVLTPHPPHLPPDACPAALEPGELPSEPDHKVRKYRVLLLPTSSVPLPKSPLLLLALRTNQPHIPYTTYHNQFHIPFPHSLVPSRTHVSCTHSSSYPSVHFLY